MILNQAYIPELCKHFLQLWTASLLNYTTLGHLVYIISPTLPSVKDRLVLIFSNEITISTHGSPFPAILCCSTIICTADVTELESFFSPTEMNEINILFSINENNLVMHNSSGPFFLCPLQSINVFCLALELTYLNLWATTFSSIIISFSLWFQVP